MKLLRNILNGLENKQYKCRKNREWRHEYMSLQMNYQEKFEQGVEQEK